MTPEKVCEVGERYSAFFRNEGVAPGKIPKDPGIEPQRDLLNPETAKHSITCFVGTYRKEFQDLGIESIAFPHEQLVRRRNTHLVAGHLAGMLPQIEDFVREDRLDKCYRWLGFIKVVRWRQTMGDGATFLMSHALVQKMVDCAREGRMPEAFYWLGFIQGCLWVTGSYTIMELKEHNKPVVAA